MKSEPLSSLSVLPTVGVIGCGWLGLPLALHLLSTGCQVVGTTTTFSKLSLLEGKGIRPSLLELKSATWSTNELEEMSIWVLAFPPKTKSTDGEWYIRAVTQLVRLAEQRGQNKLILLSSTSVYPDANEVMTEETIITDTTAGNLPIWKAEMEVLEAKISASYVLRLGGLAGEGRVLARHFAGRNGIPNGDSFVNLLHRVDAVNIISKFVLEHLPTGVYNLCSPIHPTRKSLFSNDCQRLGMELPHFLKGGEGKVISVEKLIQTGISFQYPDPREYFYF